MSATEVKLSKKKDKKERKEKKEKKESTTDSSSPERSEPVVEKKRKRSKSSLADPEEESTPSSSTSQENVGDESSSSEKKHKKEKKDKKDKKEKKQKKSKRNENDDIVQLDPPSAILPTDDEIAAFQKDKEIRVTIPDGAKLPKQYPALAFNQANFHADILKCTQSFKEPSPIQAQSWPALLQGLDVIAIAETGSGKTLGFLLPALQRLQVNGRARRRATPSTLILAPTRELALQTHAVAVECEKYVKFQSACIFGGMDKHEQMSKVNSYLDIAIATPGRLLAMIRDGSIDLSKVGYFVLDEADRLLDMGFEQDVREIASNLKQKDERQTLLFSATWPESVMKLGHSLIRPLHHLRIDIGKCAQDGDQLQANMRITQTVFVLDQRERRNKLRELINSQVGKRGVKTIVFVLYKKEVPEIESFVRNMGCSVAALSSDFAQHARIQALDNFKNGKADFLVATDVAARGLDIPNVEHVINYSFPLTIEDYVHRIGRTGRAGKTGCAWTFFTPENKGLAGELQFIMRQANQTIPSELAKFGNVIKKKEHGMYGAYAKPVGDMPKARHFKFD